MKIFHISKSKMDDTGLIDQGIDYTFFNTREFIKEDGLIGMWDRIALILDKDKIKFDLIIVEVSTPGMINSREEMHLRNFGKVIKFIHG